ncbi:PREDICTED: syntaxin-binding protein 6, partial [Fulmarus glacialis]|uniref:syntaxin-binding protein 6 n=1 Tax=Fulmarus glacialis TaxID=30455 RepID=UPI00051ACEDF
MIDMRDSVSPEEHACQMVVQSSAGSDLDSRLKTTADQLCKWKPDLYEVQTTGGLGGRLMLYCASCAQLAVQPPSEGCSCAAAPLASTVRPDLKCGITSHRRFRVFSFMCSVTNKKPAQASITKVKQFEGSTSFVRRTQWMLEQLRQVNGIDPNRDSPEFDLLFENAFDQWVASTASEKCTFFQVLHHTCQRYLTDKKPEFINCQSKIMG